MPYSVYGMAEQQDEQIVAATERVAQWYPRQPALRRVLLGTTLVIVCAAIVWFAVHDQLRLIGR
jgi:predicted secreted protein